MTVAVGSGNKKLVERSQNLSIFPRAGESATGDPYGRPEGPGGLPFDPEAEIDYDKVHAANEAQVGVLLGGLRPRHG